MEEWIKKSDAIEAIKDHSFALGDDYMEINGYGAIDDIRALPSADRWIPCSERLPERGEDVLITDEYGDVSIASIEYFSGMSEPWQWQDVYGIRIGYTVMAWMPLPEPWKGADDETTND